MASGIKLLKVLLLARLLIPATSSGEVRRVGITAAGRVATSKASAGAWSEVSTRVGSHAGLSFWRALRKQLEAKKQQLDAMNGLQNELQDVRASHREALWKAVFEIDRKFHGKLPCHLNEHVSYPGDLKALYSKRGVASARECSLMCAADPLGERSGQNTPCQSFTYNLTSTECKLFDTGESAKALWVSSPDTTSGPPCNLEGMRQEIQQAFEADMKKAVVSEKQLAQQLQQAHAHVEAGRKHIQELSWIVEKEKAANSALKNEIVRSEKKIAAPASVKPKIPKAGARPGTTPKASPSKVHTVPAHDRPHANGVKKQDKDLKRAQKHVQVVQPPARKEEAAAAAKTKMDQVQDVPLSRKRWGLALGVCGLIFAVAIMFRIHVYLQRPKSNRQQEKPSNDALTGLSGGIGPLKDT